MANAHLSNRVIIAATLTVASTGLGQNCDCNQIPGGDIAFYVDVDAAASTLAWCDRINNPNAPYQTLVEARNAIRAMRMECIGLNGLDRNITVWIREGVYEMFETTDGMGTVLSGEDTLTLNHMDSGDPLAGYYITYRAYQATPQSDPEDVLLTGGKEVDGWMTSDPVIPETDYLKSTQSLWWGNLNVDWAISDIYIDNVRMTLAREPDIGEGLRGSGFAKILESSVDDNLVMGGLGTFERTYEVMDELRIRGTAPCSGMSGGMPTSSYGYIEAVAIHEWNVHRAKPLLGMGKSEFYGPGGSPGTGNGTLVFSPEQPLGKICGPQSCTSGTTPYYQGFMTVRGESHEQLEVDEKSKAATPPWPTGFVAHAPSDDATCKLVKSIKDDRLFVEGDKRFMDQRFEWYQAEVGECQQINIRLPYDSATEFVDPNSAVTILPKQQTLVQLEGSQALPVKGIVFKDLMFGFTNYVRPGLQGGGDYQPQSITSRGVQHVGHPCQGKESEEEGENILPAAFEAKFVEGIKIEGCRFAHTGGNAVNAFTPVRQKNFCGEVEIDGIEVRESEFFDIGGTALALSKFDGDFFFGEPFVGEYSIHSPANVLVEWNYFHDIGVRYFSSAAIFCRGTQDIEIVENEIDGAMDSGIYGGVSNQMVETTARQDICDVVDITSTCRFPATGAIQEARRYTGLRGNFLVDGNVVKNTMLEMTDAAAIYLRASPGANCSLLPGDPCLIKVARVFENYVDDVASNGLLPNSNTVAHLYFDNCSANWRVSNNLFLESGAEDVDDIYLQVNKGIAKSGQASQPNRFCISTNYYEGSGTGSAAASARAEIESQLNGFLTSPECDCGTQTLNDLAEQVVPAATMVWARNSDGSLKSTAQSIKDMAGIPASASRVKTYRTPLIHP